MLATFTIIPIGSGESISPVVTKFAEEVDKSGLDYRLTAMGTIVEGEWNPVMDVINRCRKIALKHSNRVLVSITIDDRKGAKSRLTGKIDSVLAKTKKKIKT